MAGGIHGTGGDCGGPVLLRSQGCFLPLWQSQWLIGEVTLTADTFGFAQAQRRRFEVPLASITGMAVRRRKFILLQKDVVQMTYTLPDSGREKHVGFIAPDLGRWIDQLETLTGKGMVRGAPAEPAPGPAPFPRHGTVREAVPVREEQVRDLAAMAGIEGARVLWHLWRERHADIEALAALIDAPTHMDVLTLVREGINPLACRVLGGPALAFRERAFDPDTGRTIGFQWWMDRVEVPVAADSIAPLVEIHDEGDALLVVATVPRDCGHAPRVAMRAGQLVLAEKGADDAWEVAVPLPCKVLARPTGVTYANGVLSLRLAKKDRG
jgi:HSP20 family molecular chaperone IbpA